MPAERAEAEQLPEHFPRYWGGIAYTGLIGLLAIAAASGESTGASQWAPVLFGLAVLVVGAKLGGLVVERFGQPSVLDELAFPYPKLSSGDST